MKNRIGCLAVLALCTNFQPTIASSDLPDAAGQALSDDQCETPDSSDSERRSELDTCAGVGNFVLPIIGGVLGTVFASGAFLLLELRWHLRE